MKKLIAPLIEKVICYQTCLRSSEEMKNDDGFSCKMTEEVKLTLLRVTKESLLEPQMSTSRHANPNYNDFRM